MKKTEKKDSTNEILIEESYDFKNITAYLLYNDQNAFNRIYRKYFNYVLAYAKTVYKNCIEYNNSLGIPDIAGEMFEKCFINAILKTDLSLIQPNYDFKVRLTGYLRAYRDLLIDRYRKYGFQVSINSVWSGGSGLNSSNLKAQVNRRLSYDPTSEYIEQLSNNKEAVNEKFKKQLTSKERKFLKYLQKGYKLQQISEKLSIPMGSIGAVKKQLQGKVMQILDII